MELERDESGMPRIDEKGTGPDGQPVFTNRRLYMQFLAYGGCRDTAALADALESAGVHGALYHQLHDPQGVGIMVTNEDPDFFVESFRNYLQDPPFSELNLKPEYAMFGRSYTIGYEADLEHALIRKPLDRLTNPAWLWAIWYPLRRGGAFAQLEDKEQRAILAEHGRIGNAFGEADYAHDIRLACFGLDPNDNDFVVGLVGKELYPLSAIVQTMRHTRQTSEYITHLGPFFVGKVIWQSRLEGL